MKIGDKVRVIDAFNIYPTYWRMFSKMGFKNPSERKDESNDYFNDLKFKIFAIDYHEDSKELVVGIEEVNNGDQFLFSPDGLLIIDSNDTFKIDKDRDTALKVLLKNLNDSSVKHINDVRFLEDWIIDAMIEYKNTPSSNKVIIDPSKVIYTEPLMIKENKSKPSPPKTKRIKEGQDPNKK